MKLKNCCYDKAKLFHKLSCMAWFIEKHAVADAKAENDAEFQELLKKLQQDIVPYVKELHAMLCKEKVS